MAVRALDDRASKTLTMPRPRIVGVCQIYQKISLRCYEVCSSYTGCTGHSKEFRFPTNLHDLLPFLATCFSFAIDSLPPGHFSSQNHALLRVCKSSTHDDRSRVLRQSDFAEGGVNRDVKSNLAGRLC